jgi:hypothetical protein
MSERDRTFTNGFALGVVSTLALLFVLIGLSYLVDVLA